MRKSEKIAEVFS